MEVIILLALVIIGSLTTLIGLICLALGFRYRGVAANSCAACCQSVIGNVVKGSCFAIMTCLAMRGCFIALVIIGLLILASVGIYLMINSEWFDSACDWIKSIPNSIGLTASVITMKERISYTYGLASNTSIFDGRNTPKGFLQW